MTGRRNFLDVVPGLRDLARAQHGVVARDQLRELGVTYKHVANQVAAQRWTAYGPRAVVLHTGVLSPVQRRSVAVVHCGPRSGLAERTALEELGLRGWEARLLHVAVPRGTKPVPLRGVVVHQLRRLEQDELVPGSWPPCLPAARAGVDAAAAEVRSSTACGLLLAVVQQRLATPAALAVELDRPGPVRHRALLAAVLGDARDGADALSEVQMSRLVRSVGLPEPRRQVRVDTPDGPLPVDLAVDLPDGRVLVIEVDGPHHADPRVRERDAVKDAALVAAGYVVLRIPASLLRHSPGTVRAQLRRIVEGARRASRGA